MRETLTPSFTEKLARGIKEQWRGIYQFVNARRYWWAPIVIGSMVLSGCIPSQAATYEPTTPSPSMPEESGAPIADLQETLKPQTEFAQALDNVNAHQENVEPTTILGKIEKDEGIVLAAKRLLGERKNGAIAVYVMRGGATYTYYFNHLDAVELAGVYLPEINQVDVGTEILVGDNDGVLDAIDATDENFQEWTSINMGAAVRLTEPWDENDHSIKRPKLHIWQDGGCAPYHLDGLSGQWLPGE